MAPDTSPDQTPPPRRPHPDTEPLELQAAERRALPDDLPGGADRPPAAGSSVDLSALAWGESDVLKAVGEKGADGGSSNIFDPSAGGSSRFHRPSEATENLPADGLKRGTDRLLAGLGQPPQPASDVFAGDHVFGGARSGSGRYGIPLPRGDSELSTEPPPGPDLDFNALDRSDGGSNLFPDVTESEFELGASAVNLGNPGTGDPNPFGGPGSSIFASDPMSGRQAGGDAIPIMASTDDALGEPLPFDELPAASDIASNIFKGGRGPAPGAAAAVPAGFETPAARRGPAADDEPNPAGTIDWSHAPEEGDDFQISQRMTADDVADLGLPDLNDSALVREAAVAANLDMVDLGTTESMEPPAGRSSHRPTLVELPRPVPKPAPRKRKKGDRGWLPGGVLGLVTGVGACAGVYFGGLIPNADKDAVAKITRMDAMSTTPEAVARALETAERVKAADAATQSARQAADAERTRRNKAEADLGVARRETVDARRQLQATESQRKAADQRLAQADAVAQELAALKAAGGPGAKEAEAKLQVAQKEAADARTALAGVIAELRKVKLIDATAGPDALANLPAMLQRAATALASADGQKSAEAVRTAEQRAEAARAEATATKTAADKAVADSKAQVAELTARLTAQAEDHRRQLADVRAGIVTPLTTAEDRARADAADGLDRGIDAFFAGRLADAERALAAASTRDAADARIWYYLGLARWKLGNQSGAEAAFRRGAEEEGRSRPNRRVLADALSRIQGADRAVLAAYRR